ncbi:MAG: hypothetical protein PVF27_07470 [Gemmatimonadales bacterium]|jgi:hypothetical protein
MPETVGEPVTVRLERLERSHRNLRRASGVLGTVVIAVVLSGHAVPRADAASRRAAQGEVTSRRFTLVDDSDRRRAELSYQDGSTRLVFFDAAGRERLILSLARQGALSIREPDAEQRIRVSAERIAIGASDPGLGFELTPTGFQGFNFWSGSDREDAHASLWIPTDDLSHGPRLSLAHVDRGWVDIGFDQDGVLSLLFNGRRVYFGEDGQVLWEPEQ